MVHACCFHTGSASFCVDGRNDSTIFSPCQPFFQKKLLRMSRASRARSMLCAVFSWYPLACGRVPYPPYARCGIGRLCGERRAGGASVSSAFMRKKRGLRQAAAHIAGPCVRAPSEAPPRAPAPVAAGASPRPPLAPCARTSPATRTAQAFRAPLRRKKRGLQHPAAHIAGPLARTTRQEVRRARGPSELKSESSDMRGGFGSLASARQPYAGRRPASRRQSRRRSRRPAQTPAEKIGASRAFPTRSTASLPAPR